MNLKVIFWLCGATATATGLVLGFRIGSRSFGAYGDGCMASLPQARRNEKNARLASASDDPFSPDSFRDELLK